MRARFTRSTGLIGALCDALDAVGCRPITLALPEQSMGDDTGHVDLRTVTREVGVVRDCSGPGHRDSLTPPRVVRSTEIGV